MSQTTFDPSPSSSVARLDQEYRVTFAANGLDSRSMREWAMLRQSLGDTATAISILTVAIYKQGAIKLLPNLAGLLLNAGRHNEADDCLKEAIRHGIAGAEMEFQSGRLDEAMGQNSKALQHYALAIRRSPDMLEARLAIIRLRGRMGEVQEAINACHALLRRAPNNAEGWHELASLHGHAGDFASALIALGRVEKLGGDFAPDLTDIVHRVMHMCAWDHRSAMHKKLAARFLSKIPCIADPYAMLASSDDPALHRCMAECLAGAIELHVPAMPAIPWHKIHRARGDRIRVGYLGGDLNFHATSLLLAGVLEHHNRDRFQIAAFDYSVEDATSTRARMMAAFERVIHLGANGPAESAAMIAANAAVLGATQLARENRAYAKFLLPQ